MEMIKAASHRDAAFILLFVYILRVGGDRAAGGFILPDAELCQVFQLRVQRTLVVPGDIGNFVKQFRLKADAGLDFVCSHDNTPFAV